MCVTINRYRFHGESRYLFFGHVWYSIRVVFAEIPVSGAAPETPRRQQAATAKKIIKYATDSDASRRNSHLVAAEYVGYLYYSFGHFS